MTPTTDLQKLLAEATKGPWSISGTSNPPLIFQSTRDGGSGDWIASIYADKPGDHDYHKANARLIAMAPDLAARVLELEAENKRLREGLVNIKNLAIKRRNEGGVEYCLHHFEGFARTALKGGEI